MLKGSHTLQFLHIIWETFMDSFRSGADTLFILLGAIMILAMHAGFAFLELGTVRKKIRLMPSSKY